MTRARYGVVTRWDGSQWMVRVEDNHGHPCGDTAAPRLDQVERRARALMPDGPVEMDVQVVLHLEIEQRFHMAEELCRDASREVDDIVTGLRQLNMSAQDIVTLLRGRPLRVEPRRPLVVPNAEIAACGLECRTEVVAVQWEDGGFCVTTYCRSCVEADRGPWIDLPHRASAVFYEGPLRCDVCERAIPDAGSTGGDWGAA